MVQTIFTIQFIVFVVFCGLRESYTRVYKDTVISRGVFSVTFNVDWQQCIENCMKTTACYSYNYDIIGTQNHSCELSQCAGSPTGDCSNKHLRFSHGFVYQQLKNIQIKDWNTCAQVRSHPATPSQPTHYKDCAEALRSGMAADGIYTIDPDGRGRFSVRCDQTTDGGGWVLIQRRSDGKQSFYLSWQKYCNGFGKLGSEFWLGLDRIQRLTAAGNSVLKIELMNTNGQSAYALYTNFSLSKKETKFVLNAIYVNGTAGDSLQNHNGNQFSTKDQDNDHCAGCSCAQRFTSAWWYDGLHQSCIYSDLNGQYGRGISWSTWFYQISNTVMMVRPVHF